MGELKEFSSVTTPKLWETGEKERLVSDVIRQGKCSNHIHLRKKTRTKTKCCQHVVGLWSGLHFILIFLMAISSSVDMFKQTRHQNKF